jgi:hypothetical protein
VPIVALSATRSRNTPPPAKAPRVSVTDHFLRLLRIDTLMVSWHGDTMKQILTNGTRRAAVAVLATSAALVLAIDHASAQRGGMHAGSAPQTFHGSAPTVGMAYGSVSSFRGYPGLGFNNRQSGTFAAAPWRAVGAGYGSRNWGPGWGWRNRWGGPAIYGFGSGIWTEYGRWGSDPCLFLTHHGWIETGACYPPE